MRTLLLASGFSLVLGGLVQAQVSNSLIYACVNNGSGTIHIVAAGASCQTNEISLVWNAQGPAGPPGPQGPAGSPGPQGPNGVIAAGHYQCIDGSVLPGAAVMFRPAFPTVNPFGLVAGQSSFVLQPGLYRIDWQYLDGWGQGASAAIVQLLVGGTLLGGTGNPALPWFIIVGLPGAMQLGSLGIPSGSSSGLLPVPAPNTTLAFVNVFSGTGAGNCNLIITQLQ